MATDLLKLEELSEENLRKTLDQLHSHACSIVSLTLQLKEIEDQYQNVHPSINSRMEELKSLERSVMERMQVLEEKEKRVLSIEVSVEARLKDLDEKESKFALSQKSATEQRRKEVEWSLRTAEKLKLVQNSIKEHLKAIRKQDLGWSLMSQCIDEELSRKQKEFRLEVNSLEEELASQLKRFELEAKTNGRAKEESLQERSDELDWKEKQIEKRSKELELKERGLKLRLKEPHWTGQEHQPRPQEGELKDKRTTSGNKRPSAEASLSKHSEISYGLRAQGMSNKKARYSLRPRKIVHDELFPKLVYF